LKPFIRGAGGGGTEGGCQKNKRHFLPEGAVNCLTDLPSKKDGEGKTKMGGGETS